MKEPLEVVSENAGEILHLLDQLAAAMDNVLLHHGKDMSQGDRSARQSLADRARALLDQIEGESPDAPSSQPTDKA